MTWLMRILVSLGIILALVIAIVLVIGNLGTGGDATQALSMTVGSRTITVAGHYENMTQESMPDGIKVKVDGHEVADIGHLPPVERLPAAWTPHLASDDVDLTAETVRLRCGTIGVGPLDTDGSGRLMIGSDPSGAVFGVRQTSAHLDRGITGGPFTPAAPSWTWAAVMPSMA